MPSLMEIRFSPLLERFSESATIKMAQIAKELKNQGKDIIDLSLGEPDFNTPEHIKKAAIQAIEKNISHYSPLTGYPALKQAIVQKLERENGLFYHPENILVGTGAKQCIAQLVLSLISKGDEVIIPAPYWNSYVDLVNMAGGTPVIIPTRFEDGFKLQVSDLENAITPRTKLFMFSAPSNPAGVTYTKEELRVFTSVFQQNPQIVVMSDEIYEYITYDGHKHESIASFTELQSRIVIINGVSKGFAMTGWRIGYMVAPIPIIQKCSKLQAQLTSGANSVAQMAAVTALKENKNPSLKMTYEFEKRRDYIVPFFKNINGVRVNNPKGAFYIFPDMSVFIGKKTSAGKILNNVSDISMFLLSEHCVSSVSGTAFGMAFCIRFSFANSLEKIKIACARIKDGLTSLR